MKNRPLPFIVNPAAGRGRAIRHAASISRMLGDSGIAHEVIHSNAVGDVENKVLDAVSAGANEIIVAGGDGSVHEAVNGIMRASATAALGVIPLGTGNDFAKACAIPLRWEEATRLLAGRIASHAGGRPIDVGRMNDRYFANSAGLGFDAKINGIARRNRLPIGELNYLLAVFQGVRDGVITPKIRMQYGTHEYDGSVTLIEICNGQTVGGMFKMAPTASIDDGLLDLVFVQALSRLRIFSLLPRLLNGSHLAEREVSSAQVTSVTVIAEGPVPAHLDGEMQPEGHEFHIEILPRALRVL